MKNRETCEWHYKADQCHGNGGFDYLVECENEEVTTDCLHVSGSECPFCGRPRDITIDQCALSAIPLSDRFKYDYAPTITAFSNCTKGLTQESAPSDSNYSIDDSTVVDHHRDDMQWVQGRN
jgi:hypothetical protein